MEVDYSTKQKYFKGMCGKVEEQKSAAVKALAEQCQAGVEVTADHGHAVSDSFHDLRVPVPTPDRVLKGFLPSVVEARARGLEVHDYSTSSNLHMAMSTRCSMECSSGSAGLSLSMSSPAAAPTATSSTAAVSIAGDPTSTASSVAAYKLFDRMPCRSEWSSDCALSIMVCRALFPISEDLLHPILAPYGVKRLVVKPRATTARGSEYVTAIVELNSRDAAARARVALQGQCLFDGCCYLRVSFALPHELPATATSSEATSATAQAACSMHDGVSQIEMPAVDNCLAPTHEIAVPTSTFSLVHSSTNTVSTASAASVLQLGYSELCDEQPSAETCETHKAEMVLSLSPVETIAVTAKMSLTPTDASIQAAHDSTVSSTTLTVVSACCGTIDTDDTSVEELFLDMCPSAPMSSEVSIFQPLKLFSDCWLGAFVQWPSPPYKCVSLPVEFLEHDNQLQCKEDKKLVHISATANQATSGRGSPPINQVWTVLLSNSSGGFPREHLWDPGIELLHGDELGYDCTSVEHLVDRVMEIVAPLTTTCELQHSSSVVENILAAPYSSWCMRFAKLAIIEIQEYLSYLQLKPPWPPLVPVSSASESGNNVRAVSKPFNMTGIAFQLNLNTFVAWYMFFARAHFYSPLRHAKQLLGADNCTLQWQNSTSLQNICWIEWSSLLMLIGWFLMPLLKWIRGLLSAMQRSHDLGYSSGNKSSQLLLQTTVSFERYLERRKSVLPSFTARKIQKWDPGIWALLTSSAGIANKFRLKTGEIPKLYIKALTNVHVDRDYGIDYACYFNNVRADDDYHYDAVLDCIDCYLNLFSLVQVLVNNGYHSKYSSIQEQQLQWDPGGFAWRRLGVKPKLKEGGLSATFPWCAHGLANGLASLGLACQKTRRQPLQILGEGNTDGAAWNRKASAWLLLLVLLHSVAMASCSSLISRSSDL